MTRKKFMLQRQHRQKEKLLDRLSVFAPYKKEGVQHPPVYTPCNFRPLAPLKELRCIK